MNWYTVAAVVVAFFAGRYSPAVFARLSAAIKGDAK